MIERNTDCVVVLAPPPGELCLGLAAMARTVGFMS